MFDFVRQNSRGGYPPRGVTRRQIERGGGYPPTRFFLDGRMGGSHLAVTGGMHLGILCVRNSSFERQLEEILFYESFILDRIGVRHPNFRLHCVLLQRFLSTALSARFLSGVSLIQRTCVSLSRLFGLECCARVLGCAAMK